MTRRSIAFLALATAAAAALLCFEIRQKGEPALAAELAGASRRADIPDRSIYLLTSTWNTDDGRTIGLGDLQGHFQILAMIFTSCPRACPTLVKELQALERRMAPDDLDVTRFVLISIDPERDTVAALHAYRERMGLGARWTLLRGRADDVRELAATLGFGYGKDETEQLVHSKLVTVLDRSGRVAHQEPELGSDPRRLLDAINGTR